MKQFRDYVKHIRQEGRQYFTVDQVISDLNISKNAALNAIFRLKAHGDIISPAQGLYVIVPAENQIQGSIPEEEMVPILMKYLNADYYISLLSGAEFYGASHQKPARFQIITNKRIRSSREFGQIKLEIVYKKLLSHLPIKNVVVKTGYLKVAEPELVALDILSYQKRSGGLNHIATVLSELIDAIDPDKLIYLAKKIDEKAWLQRLGFILDKIDPINGDKKNLIIEKLKADIEFCNFVPLASEIPIIGCKRVKKWFIIENTDIESDI